MADFNFYSEYNLPVLLGIKARNVNEMIEFTKTVPAGSIYFHTHRFLKQHHYLAPEPPNDFAYWVRNTFNLRALGERIASINIASLPGIEDVRKSLVKSLEDYKPQDSYSINCLKGEEFQFMSCKTFCLPLNLTASSLAEFAGVLNHLPVGALYYHIFETQLRLGRESNDFALWFKDLGENELAEKVAKIDPYTNTIDGLRQDILALVKQYDKHK